MVWAGAGVGMAVVVAVLVLRHKKVVRVGISGSVVLREDRTVVEVVCLLPAAAEAALGAGAEPVREVQSPVALEAVGLEEGAGVLVGTRAGGVGGGTVVLVVGVVVGVVRAASLATAAAIPATMLPVLAVVVALAWAELFSTTTDWWR
jgi:hypothetical protein